MTDLHRDAAVVDCHNDFILLVARKLALGFPNHFAEYWLPEMRTGGVGVQVVPIYVDPEYAPEGALRRTMFLVELVHRTVEQNAQDVALCKTGDEIGTALGAGKIAFVLALEGCEGIADTVELIETFYRLGVRIVSLTHFGRTAFADGSGEDDAGARLTRKGVAAVGEIQRLGIVMDVSHLGIAATDHVLELAARPVIASHSSVRALCNHHRNLEDRMIERIATSGGVVGINLFPWFIDKKNPTIDRVVDHIEHIAGLVGIDHVGIGPDFIREYVAEFYGNYPDLTMEGVALNRGIEGLEYLRDLPNLTAALLRRGFEESDVRKVLGENFLRVFRQVMGVRA